MEEKMTVLTGRDSKTGYALLKEMLTESAESPVYNGSFEDFLPLLKSRSSNVRTGGVLMCCTQARWDGAGKLAAHFGELTDRIEDALAGMKPSAYGASMAPLTERDTEELQKLL